MAQIVEKTEPKGTNVVSHRPRSVTVDMAERYGMEPAAFEATIRATCLPPEKDGRQASREEFAAFLLIAKQYGLNPLTKEIYGLRSRGGIVPVVSVDGWLNLTNSAPQMNGLEFDDHLDEKGNLTAITARIWRKDRDKPIVVTEYMAECKRETEPWKRWPRRMLRHKAVIQCARYAFGFAGIYDPDEAERIADVSGMRDVTPAPSGRDAGPPPPPPPPVERDVLDLAAPARDQKPEEWTDPETGEITELPPVPLKGASPLPVEAAASGLTEDEQSWLRDLDGALSGCEDDLTCLAEEQIRVMAPMRTVVSAPAWTAAEAVVQRHLKRVQGAAG